MNLSLKTPCEIFEANAGFKRELSVTNAQGQIIEESLTWGVDSTIQVPSMSQTTAELAIYEDEFQGNFSIRTDVAGKVLVSVTNIRDNNCFLKSLSGDIDEIVGAEINGLKGFSMDKQNHVVSFTTNGRCHFRYGIEQHIKLSQEPLQKGYDESKFECSTRVGEDWWIFGPEVQKPLLDTNEILVGEVQNGGCFDTISILYRSYRPTGQEDAKNKPVALISLG